MVRYIVILMTVILYWFLLSIAMGMLLEDPFLTSSNITGEENYSALNTDLVNFSSGGVVGEERGIDRLGTALKFLFGFSVPDNLFGLPNTLRNIISFINWFVAIITLAAVFKVANIIHGG